jgi:hypothetical protein
MNISEKVGNVPSVSGIHDNRYFLINGITDNGFNWLMGSTLPVLQVQNYFFIPYVG